MVIMASGIARGRVSTTATAKTVESRKMATCSLGLPCTFLTYDIRLWLIDTCQIKSSADQYRVTISRAQVYSSSRLRVLFKLTAYQVLVFDLIAGSYQVNCWKLSRTVRKPNPDSKVNEIITVSSLQMFFVGCFCFVFVIINPKYTEGQTKTANPAHCKVTKLKSKFNFFLG